MGREDIGYNYGRIEMLNYVKTKIWERPKQNKTFIYTDKFYGSVPGLNFYKLRNFL